LYAWDVNISSLQLYDLPSGYDCDAEFVVAQFMLNLAAVL
jgi:hypothetical protein